MYFILKLQRVSCLVLVLQGTNGLTLTKYMTNTKKITKTIAQLELTIGDTLGRNFISSGTTV